MTCPSYIFCRRLDKHIMYAVCQAVQNEGCLKDCEGNKSLPPFWERKRDKGNRQ